MEMGMGMGMGMGSDLGSICWTRLTPREHGIGPLSHSLSLILSHNHSHSHSHNHIRHSHDMMPQATAIATATATATARTTADYCTVSTATTKGRKSYASQGFAHAHLAVCLGAKTALFDCGTFIAGPSCAFFGGRSTI